MGRSRRRKGKVRESFFLFGASKKRKGKGEGTEEIRFPHRQSAISLSPPSYRHFSISRLARRGRGILLSFSLPNYSKPKEGEPESLPKSGEGEKNPLLLLLLVARPILSGVCGSVWPSAQPSTSKAEAGKKRVAA